MNQFWALSIGSLLLLVLYVWSVIWAVRDAEKRGKSGCLVALLVILLAYPIGLLVWLIFRPEDRRDRRLDHRPTPPAPPLPRPQRRRVFDPATRSWTWVNDPDESPPDPS